MLKNIVLRSVGLPNRLRRSAVSQQIVSSNAVLVGREITPPLSRSLRRAIYSWLTAAANNHSPKLSGVGGGPAVSGVACGALARGSGDFALGGNSFAIFESSFFGF